MSKSNNKNKISEEYLNELIAKRKQLIKETNTLKEEIHNLETAYLEFTQGQPLIKSLEGYLTSRAVQKKYVVSDNDRIFTREFREEK